MVVTQKSTEIFVVVELFMIHQKGAKKEVILKSTTMVLPHIRALLYFPTMTFRPINVYDKYRTH